MKYSIIDILSIFALFIRRYCVNDLDNANNYILIFKYENILISRKYMPKYSQIFSKYFQETIKNNFTEDTEKNKSCIS